MTSATLEQVYSGKVKALAGKILRNKGISVVDSDDITQEVAIAKWRGGYDALEWKSANLAKGAIAREKALKRGGSITKCYVDSSNDPEYCDNPLDRLIYIESATAVNDAIARLPFDLSRVIKMRFFDGMTFCEIAFQCTGNPKSVQGVVNKLKRAMEILSEELARFA
jgi:DNA-directed RNA polymerase specialized sigma24 family protein